jgi:Peroxisomal membrane protein (Pex16)
MAMRNTTSASSYIPMTFWFIQRRSPISPHGLTGIRPTRQGDKRRLANFESVVRADRHERAKGIRWVHPQERGADLLDRVCPAHDHVHPAECVSVTTPLTPGRFKDAELASETRSLPSFSAEIVYATLNLVSLYHDSLLAKAVANLPPSVRKPEPSPHNRYTQFWTKASPNYKRLALAIVVIQYGEVLCEMGAKKKWGEKGRWHTIVALEALK